MAVTLADFLREDAGSELHDSPAPRGSQNGGSRSGHSCPYTLNPSAIPKVHSGILLLGFETDLPSFA